MVKEESVLDKVSVKTILDLYEEKKDEKLISLFLKIREIGLPIINAIKKSGAKIVVDKDIHSEEHLENILKQPYRPLINHLISLLESKKIEDIITAIITSELILIKVGAIDKVSVEVEVKHGAS